MEKEKKGVYLVQGDLSVPMGINRKINSQIDTFREAGFSIDIHKVEDKRIFGYKILHRLPFANIIPVWKREKELLEYDFIYLRKPFGMNAPFIKFLKWIKSERPYLKIIMEIPTYPYDKEITKDKKNWPFYVKEVLARKKIKKYIDVLSVPTDDKEIFGVKTIKINNGYDFKKSHERKFDRNKESIDIAIVAIFYAWHGFERLIKGLYLYYQNGNKRQVNLHFVGDGSELSTYKKMVSKYKLNKYIKFYGMQNKEHIEKIYNKCDIGASSFGLYKINIDCSYTLKSREYLSVGLPIICGGKMDVMEYPDLKEYILEFPNDSTDVSVEKVVEFYDKIYKNKTKEEIDEMISCIRGVAIKNLNMNKAMEGVINYINES